MRSLFRILLVVAVSYAIAAAVLALGMRIAAMAFVPRSDGAPATGYLSIGLAIRIAAAVLVGYVAARFAPPGRITLTVGLLAGVFLVLAVVSARMGIAAHQPPSYLPLATLLGIIGLWTGAMTERAIHAKR